MKLSELITLATVRMAQDGDVDVEIYVDLGDDEYVFDDVNVTEDIHPSLVLAVGL